MIGVLPQVKHPATDLPIGIVGSLLICGFLYSLMCGASTCTGAEPQLSAHISNRHLCVPDVELFQCGRIFHNYR